MNENHPSDVRPDDDPNTPVNAVVGAVVSLVAAPLLPLAAVAGGGVAGYLQRGDIEAGATAGALSGAVATVPAFLVVWFVGAWLLLGVVHPFGGASVLAVLAFVAVAGYFVVAGTIGGALGAYLGATAATARG